MRFERVRLENFKCYADADLRLDRGVTVIHGVNGSGKSSLLEACFFALYGHRALGVEKTLDDVVTIGAEETTVELWFAHGGGDYHIERRIRVRGEAAQTVACVLETPDGTVEGATDVLARVVELLRMDAEAFVNCAYVRQGEVNKLINASPGERQDMIDDLLQLGTLEDYRERASDARVGVKRVRHAKGELLSDLGERIEQAEEADLHGRMNALRTELNETRGDIESYEANRESAAETLAQAESILDAHEERRQELDELDADVEELTDDISAAETTREEASKTIRSLRDTAETLREQIGEALAETDFDAETADALDVETADAEVIDAETIDAEAIDAEILDVETIDAETIDVHIGELQDERESIRDQIEEQRVEAQRWAGDAETARERAKELDAEAEETREAADDLEDELKSAREGIADRRERVAEFDAAIEEKRAAFEDAPAEFGEASEHREAVAEAFAEARERVTELEARAETQREAIEEAERLRDAGKCPECGQSVDGSPHVESLDDDREALADLEADLDAAREERDRLEARRERARELETVEDEVGDLRSKRKLGEQWIEDRRASVEEREARVAELRETVEERTAAADENRSEAETDAERAEEAQAAIGELNAESSDLAERIERLEQIREWLDEFDETAAETERLRERRESIEKQNELRRERLAEKRARKRELEAEFDEANVEHARDEKRRAEGYIEKVDAKLAELGEHRDELQSELGAVENELESLEESRERREELQATVERLDSLYDEADQLQNMYADLRAELRQRNVRKLEELLNETFELVYQNDSYSRIELDGEYDLTVYQKSGEPLDPEQLSGGERALFNLSLRCAIYRLLAEGIEGAAPMPPLILDEPTVFLDSGHVSKLVELVEAMRGHGVEQIVVVSHDEELVGAADDLVTVRKDATSNRSTVEREQELGAVAEVAGD